MHFSRLRASCQSVCGGDNRMCMDKVLNHREAQQRNKLLGGKRRKVWQELIISPNRGNLLCTPKYKNPYHKDPPAKKVPLISGNPHFVKRIVQSTAFASCRKKNGSGRGFRVYRVKDLWALPATSTTYIF